MLTFRQPRCARSNASSFAPSTTSSTTHKAHSSVYFLSYFFFVYGRSSSTTFYSSTFFPFPYVKEACARLDASSAAPNCFKSASRFYLIWTSFTLQNALNTALRYLPSSGEKGGGCLAFFEEDKWLLYICSSFCVFSVIYIYPSSQDGVAFFTRYVTGRQGCKQFLALRGKLGGFL